jgi:aminopeptidase N
LAHEIGRPAIFNGLAEFLKTHSFGEATPDDLIASWSHAAGRDLTHWSAEWLETPGVNTLEVRVQSIDGVVEDASIIQRPSSSSPILRTHDVTLSAYDLREGVLIARRPLRVSVAGEHTEVREMVGGKRPDAVLLNAPTVASAKVARYGHVETDRAVRELLASKAN